MDQDEQRKAICDAVPRSADFSADDMAQMNRLLLACQAVLTDDDETGPSLQDIHILLANVTNGYGCWLDTVEAAILNTDIGDPIDQAVLFGSFRMARSFLLALDWARTGGPPQPPSKLS